MAKVKVLGKGEAGLKQLEEYIPKVRSRTFVETTSTRRHLCGQLHNPFQVAARERRLVIRTRDRHGMEMLDVCFGSCIDVRHP